MVISTGSCVRTTILVIFKARKQLVAEEFDHIITSINMFVIPLVRGEGYLTVGLIQLSLSLLVILRNLIWLVLIAWLTVEPFKLESLFLFLVLYYYIVYILYILYNNVTIPENSTGEYNYTMALFSGICMYMYVVISPFILCSSTIEYGKRSLVNCAMSVWLNKQISAII